MTNEYNKPACTEINSKWNNQALKQVLPMKIKDMDIQTDSRMKKSDVEVRQAKRNAKLNFDPRRAGKEKVKPEVKVMFHRIVLPDLFLTRETLTALNH